MDAINAVTSTLKLIKTHTLIDCKLLLNQYMNCDLLFAEE